MNQEGRRTCAGPLSFGNHLWRWRPSCVFPSWRLPELSIVLLHPLPIGWGHIASPADAHAVGLAGNGAIELELEALHRFDFVVQGLCRTVVRHRRRVHETPETRDRLIELRHVATLAGKIATQRFSIAQSLRELSLKLLIGASGAGPVWAAIAALLHPGTTLALATCLALLALTLALLALTLSLLTLALSLPSLALLSLALLSLALLALSLLALSLLSLLPLLSLGLRRLLALPTASLLASLRLQAALLPALPTTRRVRITSRRIPASLL
jgi:hypothetical protein